MLWPLLWFNSSWAARIRPQIVASHLNSQQKIVASSHILHLSKMYGHYNTYCIVHSCTFPLQDIPTDPTWAKHIPPWNGQAEPSSCLNWTTVSWIPRSLSEILCWLDLGVVNNWSGIIVTLCIFMSLFRLIFCLLFRMTHTIYPIYLSSYYYLSIYWSITNRIQFNPKLI